MKRILASFALVLLFVGLARAQNKTMTGTVIDTQRGMYKWTAIVIRVGDKKYYVYTESGQYPTPKTVGTIDEVGRKVQIFYTKIVHPSDYDGDVIATKIVEMTGSSNSRQTMLSAKGFFCGQSEPGWVNVHLQVGNSVQVFSTSPDAGPKKRGFSKPFYQLTIGTELIIKYKIEESYGSRGNWIYEAIATGRRNRSVRRCVSD